MKQIYLVLTFSVFHPNYRDKKMPPDSGGIFLYVENQSVLEVNLQFHECITSIHT